MTVTVISPLDRTSPSFKTDVDALFMTKLPLLSSELSVLQVDVNGKQLIATGAAADATNAAAAAVPAAATAVAAKNISVSLKPTQSATAPLSPLQGSQWTNSDTGRHYLYYVDANGGHWIETGGLVVDNATAVTELSGQIAAPGGSALMGVLAAGVGASPRKAQDKLRDFVSVKDYGAIGDGVADDTAAIQAALNASKNVSFPPTPGSYYKITNTVALTSEHVLTGSGIGSARIVMTDPAKWAFACDPAVSTYFNNGESAGGGVFDLDIRARYGIRIGTVNLANSASYNYADATAFFAANSPVQQFRVERCNLISDIDYAAAYTYIAASPNWNTLIVPTNADLYMRGCGVLFSNNYRGAVRDCQIKFYGIGVYLFGADLAEVSTSRIANNLRHIHVQGQWASGSQVDIHHNDLLANYRAGGVYLTSGHNAVRANYFENTGGATNSTINSYITDAGQTTNVSENRFDDYGSTKTSGALMTFAGVGGATAWGNRVADNRPAGAGTLAPLGVETANWKPSLTALFCQHGLVSIGDNDSSFPRLRHPLVSYDLDGCNPLEWAPTRKHRDVGYADISGGGIMTYKFAQDSAGLWFLNTAPFENGITLKPADHQLTKGLNYTVIIRGKCIISGAGPYNVFTLIKWTTAAGVTSTIFAGDIAFTNNTAVQEVSKAVTIPAASAGYFTVFSVITGLNLYGIRIVEA